ncbi:hypothetical protein D3C80_1600670 [compost metagenome]
MHWTVCMRFLRLSGSVKIKTPVFVRGQKAQYCLLVIKNVYFFQCMLCCMDKSISKSAV